MRSTASRRCSTSAGSISVGRSVPISPPTRAFRRGRSACWQHVSSYGMSCGMSACPVITHACDSSLSCATNTCIHESTTQCIYSCRLLDAVKPSMLYMYVFISSATMPGRARALPRGPQDPARSYKSGTRARVDLHTDPDSRNVYMRILDMSTPTLNCTTMCVAVTNHICLFS